MNNDTGNRQNSFTDRIRAVLLTLLVYFLTFEEPIEVSFMPSLYGILNITALMSIPLLLYHMLRYKTVCRYLKDPALIGVLIFCLSLTVGYRHYHYQSWMNTLFSIFDSMRFWMLLCTFYFVFRRFDFGRHADNLFTHTAIITVFMTGTVIADMALHIWPRQVYRFGLGSIQIFYEHPTYLAVHSLFILCILCMLVPYQKKAVLFMPCMLFNMFMTLRLRILGLTVCILMMFVFFVLLGQRLSWKNGLALTAGAFLVGGRRFIRYYTSAEALTMARGQFAYNGWKIAVKNFPFGTGAGTFGSRVAQRFYSPLYYQYGMIHTLGMDPIWPAYACDTFWPMIMAESGFLGLAGYLAMVFSLFAKIQRLRDKSLWVYMGAICAFMYELLETTGALAFSDVTAVGIALVLGLALGMDTGEMSSEEYLENIICRRKNA